MAYIFHIWVLPLAKRLSMLSLPLCRIGNYYHIISIVGGHSLCPVAQGSVYLNKVSPKRKYTLLLRVPDGKYGVCHLLQCGTDPTIPLVLLAFEYLPLTSFWSFVISPFWKMKMTIIGKYPLDHGSGALYKWWETNVAVIKANHG